MGQGRMDCGVVADDKMWRLSRPELERRWKLVRDHLRERQIDALIVQSYEDKTGGYVKWLTDVPAGYPRTVIFHADDLMTIIDHGPHGARRTLADSDRNHPGVGEVITNWGFYNAHYNHHLNAEDAVTVIKGRGYRRVAMVNTGGLPHGFVSGIGAGLAGLADIVDATDFLDRVKAIKSAEEISLIRRTTATQDDVFAKLLGHIEPGMRDFEINAFIDHQLQLRGAERGTYIGKSAPIGEPATFGYRHFQGRTMGRGDHICVLLESNGFGGYWTEMARIICFGTATAELKDGFELCRIAQAETATWCKAGTPAAEVFERYNSFMTSHGAAPERRLHSHSQGHDMVERPLIRADETMAIENGCNLAIHPTHATKTMCAHICDNYLIDTDGGGSFLHRTPKQIFEL